MKALIEQAPWLTVVLPFIGLSILLALFALFDFLVRWEYKHHPEAWQADGKPNGFFWRAAWWPLTDWARNQLCLEWIFSTPPWVKQSVSCRRALLWYRCLFAGWNAMVIGLMASFYFFP